MAGRDDVSLPDSVGSDESDMLSVSDSEPEVSMDVEGEEDVVSLPPSFGSDDEFDQDLVSLPSSCEFDSDPSVPDDHDDEAPGPAAQAIRSNSKKKTRNKFGGPVNTALDHSVPDPAAARRIADSHDCLELYSPPRVLPMAAKLVGAKGIFSLDIETGWDFRRAELRSLSLELLSSCKVQMLFLSPPCTVFSSLQNLWNKKRCSPEKWKQRWEQGCLFVDHSCEAAQIQIRGKRRFMYEHPATATSWSAVASLAQLRRTPVVQEVLFDQCALGLKSPRGEPMKKKTRVLSNCGALIRELAKYQCDKSHSHRRIEGSQDGFRLSTWAQYYPERMVEVLARSAK